MASGGVQVARVMWKAVNSKVSVARLVVRGQDINAKWSSVHGV